MTNDELVKEFEGLKKLVLDVQRQQTELLAKFQAIDFNFLEEAIYEIRQTSREE